jgi:4-alpha-glucanotransferase
VKPAFDLKRRSAGVLLHVTSLPGPHGNGDLGAEARAFVDFLADAGQRFWQTLPINPVGPGNSPYSGASAFAGSALLISLSELVAEGLLEASEIRFRIPGGNTDYRRAEARRNAALRSAFERFRGRARKYARELSDFRRRSAYWLSDYCLYMALRGANGGRRWPEWAASSRQQQTLFVKARRELAEEIAYFEFEQLVFDRQWRALRDYARSRGVGMIGDAPIFISHESADVWAHPGSFLLDRKGEPTHVAGVPPDYFSKTGQRWGNPLYRWKALARDDYAWWIERFRALIERFDAVRLDHFIGFARFWQIEASEASAVNGRWKKGPGAQLFERAREQLGSLPFIAEDLGEVTDEVRRLRDDLGLPGMRVLQFGFGENVGTSEFAPHNYVPHAVAYTGTHDNDTMVGWFQQRGGRGQLRTSAQAKTDHQAAIAYLAGPDAGQLSRPIHWEAIRAVYASVANTVLIPLQDILGLPSDARMNTPGQAEGNWEWRVNARELTPKLAATLRSYAATYGRLPQSEPTT